jgi:hypothetical protein
LCVISKETNWFQQFDGSRNGLLLIYSYLIDTCDMYCIVFNNKIMFTLRYRKKKKVSPLRTIWWIRASKIPVMCLAVYYTSLTSLKA